MKSLSFSQLVTLPKGSSVKISGVTDPILIENLIIDLSDCSLKHKYSDQVWSFRDFAMLGCTSEDAIHVYKYEQPTLLKALMSQVDQLSYPRTFNGYEFYLTGSRFFGDYKDNSDYDFFTQDSTSLRMYLEGEGFKQLNFTDYQDQMTSCVYRRIFDDGRQMDIQCVKNALMKKNVQDLLTSIGFKFMYKNIKSQYRDKLWDLGFCLVNGFNHKDINKIHGVCDV